MSIYIFKYNSLEEEEQKVKDARSDVEFFKEHKIYFTLPEKDIADEYDIEDYNQTTEFLESVWLKEAESFDKKIEAFFNTKIEPITVKFTKYGCMGSYHPPIKTVIINKMSNKENIIRTIKHEIIHLYVHDYIEENKLNHQDKEKIVNKLFEIVDM